MHYINLVKLLIFSHPSKLPFGYRFRSSTRGCGILLWNQDINCVQGNTSMNYRKESSHPKLDLKLNLSPPRETIFPRGEISPSRSSSSPTSSCISREPTPEEQLFGYPNSQTETTSMMLVGCPRCLMYVMLSVEDPKCPKCKSSMLLDFFHEDRIKKK